MPSPHTNYDLSQITDYMGFEPFCSDLMSLSGFKGITPIGGYKDKGRDALLHDEKISTVFAYSVREDWRKKLFEDLEKIKRHQHPCQQVIFVTNRPVAPSEYDTLILDVNEKFGWELDIYDIRRVATLVDNHYPELITRYPGLFKLSSSQFSDGRPYCPITYCGGYLDTTKENTRSTVSLFANHKAITIFASEISEDEIVKENIPAASISTLAKVTLLLGEAGGGKSTSLQKTARTMCEQYLSEEVGSVPVLVESRNWTQGTRYKDLVIDQLTSRGFSDQSVSAALDSGNFLLIFDGINEVFDDRSNRSLQDLIAFISRYHKNKYLLSCRSSDVEETGLLNELDDDSRVYVLQRMSRDQLREYASTFLQDNALDPDAFSQAIGIDNDEVYNIRSSLVHLARIPLFLQVFLESFKQSGVLPDSRVELLRDLVSHLLSREKARGTPIEALAYNRVLSYIANRSTESGERNNIQVDITLHWLSEIFPVLRQGGVIGDRALISDIWRCILSANFLVEGSYSDVSWLHQLLYEYFQGVHLAQVWTVQLPSAMELEQNRLLGSPLTVAVGVSTLSIPDSALFIRNLSKSPYRETWHVFQALSETRRESVANEIVKQVHRYDDFEENDLLSIVGNLPYVEIVDALDSAFYDYSDPRKRAQIVEALGKFMICHQTTIVSMASKPFQYIALEEQRLDSTRTAVDRCVSTLGRYQRSDIELVRFHAAKGLIETDRSGSIKTLRELHDKGSADIRALVQELTDEWDLG